MELVTIARRYAKALFALDHGVEIKDLLMALADLYKQPIFIELVHNLLVPSEHKARIIIELFNSTLPDYQQNFIKLLCAKQRFNTIKFIKREFNKLLAERDKIIYVKFETALLEALPPQLDLVENLEKVLHSKIELKVKRHHSLLAGARIKVAEQIVDGSLKAKFEALHAALLAH